MYSNILHRKKKKKKAEVEGERERENEEKRGFVIGLYRSPFPCLLSLRPVKYKNLNVSTYLESFFILWSKVEKFSSTAFRFSFMVCCTWECQPGEGEKRAKGREAKKGEKKERRDWRDVGRAWQASRGLSLNTGEQSVWCRACCSAWLFLSDSRLMLCARRYTRGPAVLSSSVQWTCGFVLQLA